MVTIIANTDLDYKLLEFTKSDLDMSCMLDLRSKMSMP